MDALDELFTGGDVLAFVQDIARSEHRPHS